MAATLFTDNGRYYGTRKERKKTPNSVKEHEKSKAGTRVGFPSLLLFSNLEIVTVPSVLFISTQHTWWGTVLNGVTCSTQRPLCQKGKSLII